MTRAGLHTIVCVKVVPRPEEVKINPATNTLDRGNARSQINPPDVNALEIALTLKERHGGRVSLLSMGPPFVVPQLRVGLGMGADHVYLLSDRAFGGADTLATSYTLAKGIQRIGAFDLVLCGEESSDGATAQVPPGIAEWLNVPQITYVSELELDGDRALGRRDLPGGHEIVATRLPAVVSVTSGANEPRFIVFDRQEWIDDPSVVTTWTAADLTADPELLGLGGSATTVAGIRSAGSTDRKREFINGTPEETAQLLFERIREFLEPVS
jgi:electron transfer flavoprotein beta subunit